MILPPKERIQRLEALRSAMERARIGAAYLVSDAAVHYYSGFTGSESALLISKRDMHLITDFRYQEEAEKTAPGFTLCVRTSRTLAHEAGALARSMRARRVWVEERELSIKGGDDFRAEAPRCELVPGQEALLRPRQVKSAWEIARITDALRIAEEAFVQLKGQLQVGMTEMDVARELEYRMACLGAQGRAFPTIAAVDATSSLPHAQPGKRRLHKGALLLIDWGACLRRYNSDLTRVIFVDSIPRLWQDRYARVLEAQAAGIRAVRAGVPAAAADIAARDVFSKYDLEKLFGHSFGHGVGLEVHESPSFSRRCEQPLQAGMVLTAEPGVYFPGEGGIRIEDMIVVTPTGCRVISRLDKALESAIA